MACKMAIQIFSRENWRGKYAMSKAEVLTERERKLLIALVKMVDQYLDEYGDEVDSRAMSAGEHAIEALATFGLMENINTRFGRWTEAGNQFREEFNRIK